MFNFEKLRAIGMMVAKQAQEKAAANYEAANDIIDMSPLLKVWKPGTMANPEKYARGDVRIHDDMPWWCVTGHAHSGEMGWQPGGAGALWALYHGRDAAHALPFAAEGHNPYMAGHYCTENGTAYRCKRDNVVHAPSVLPEAWEAE